MIRLLKTNAIADVQLRTDLQDNAAQLSDSPNYWIDRRAIENPSQNSSPAEKFVTALYPLVKSLLPDEWTGAEYWVQVYEGGRGLAMHFDKDEHAMKEHKQMVNPIFSSVYYLSGDEKDQPPQAPTVITDQLYDHKEGCPVPEDPTMTTLVFPRRNSYVLFKGNAGHGVLDSGAGGVRTTLLVNWWASKPQSINPCPKKQNKADDDKEEQQESSGLDEINASLEKLALPKDSTENAKEEGSDVNETQSVIIELDVNAVPEDDLLMVDDVLDLHKVDLSATQTITFKHEGLSLYPIDNEQLTEMEDKLRVGAAFLLTSAFESETESEGSSESE